MKMLLTAAVVALAALTFNVGSASAHGCHPDVRQDGGGWHRHARNDCDRIQSHRDGGRLDEGEHHHRDYDRDREPRCVKRCHYIGPIKQCDTVCR